MDSTIQKVIDRLKEYPDVKFTNTDDLITVDPKDDNGFSVTLAVQSSELVVWANSWHEHFDKVEEEQALNCFAFLLSDECRLRVEYKGEKPKSWTLESLKNGKWIGDSTTGLFNLKFWLPTRVQYFQNGLFNTNKK